MKKLFTLIALIPILFALQSKAQVKADDIIGKWLSESGRAKIEIFKSGNQYYGKIIWLKFPNDDSGQPKTDKNNPNPDKRKHPLLGLLLLKSLEFDGVGVWSNGSIYDPENGKEYKCKITKNAQGNLDIRGYIGLSLIGRTTVWKKAE